MNAVRKPGPDTLLSSVLVSPRLLDGYDLADYVSRNREHLQCYFDSLRELGAEVPEFDEWCSMQWDLAVEFRARLADEAREG